MISGAALVVENLATAMAKRGHQVLVLAASDRSQGYLVEKGNLAVLRLKALHNPLRVGQRFLTYPRRSVMNALRKFAPDIIHVHEPLQMGWLGIEYAKQTNTSITLTVHQAPSLIASYLPGCFRVYTETILWAYARWLAKKFTSITSPTQTISALITQMTGSKTDTISSGADLEIFRPALSCREGTATRQKWNLPENAPILLHVGRLDVEKRVDRVIQAAAQTLLTSGAHLLIVGDGCQKSNLVRLCNDLRIAERVHFIGFVSARQGLPGIYQVAHLFVTASEIETQGIVLLEAAASGLPIVAVRTTCIPEIVHDGINGYLEEPGDVHGMSNAMNLLLRN
ncbi:MAG: glycosyltransferase, partial [Anaerolineales bacterium]